MVLARGDGGGIRLSGSIGDREWGVSDPDPRMPIAASHRNVCSRAFVVRSDLDCQPPFCSGASKLAAAIEVDSVCRLQLVAEPLKPSPEEPYAPAQHEQVGEGDEERQIPDEEGEAHPLT